MISQKIKMLRKLANKTQKQVSDILGVAQNTYSCYERGSVVPDLNTINNIATLFNVSPSFLIDDDYQIENGDIVIRKANELNKNKIILICESNQFVYNLNHNQIEKVRQFIELLKTLR